MLWLAIHFPDLPLDLWDARATATAGTDDAPAPPFAVTEQRRVCRANAAARAAGVQPGMSAATAAALCGGLALRERRPEQEAQRLAQLAQGALAFTPQVCIDAGNAFAGTGAGSAHGKRTPAPFPDTPTLLLEIGGCLRLFRGLAALQRRVQRFLRRERVSARLACAQTPLAARLFAVNGISTHTFFNDDGQPDASALRAALGALPVAGLGFNPQTESSLMNMGFRQLNDISTLPRPALGRRFGQEFIGWLDRVTGTREDPRTPVAPETFFVREVNFLDGIVHHEGLAFPMQRLLGEFTQFLRQRQFATQQLTWRLTHVDGSAQEIAIHCTRPETAPAALLALTRVRLDATRLPAPVETLRLACRQFVPLAAAPLHTGLFPASEAAANEAALDSLVDRLRARLGEAHCREFTAVDSWQPEAAQTVADLRQGSEATRVRVTVKQEHADYLPTHAHLATTASASERARPLWLLREPARVHRDGAQLLWNGRLEIIDGPERIDTGWWAQPVQRDYFVARHEAGTLCWVFHDHARGEWFVQGVFG
jgi:protein ImuB